MRKLPVVELLGKKWFVDERLKEYRSVDKVDVSILFLSFREMDDMIEFDDILKHPITFGLNPENGEDRDTIEKLGKLFDSVMTGDKTALEEMAEL